MYNEIQKIFSIKLEDFDLIRIALTHPSYTQSYNLPETECYERLEFLGDAMLKLAASEILYKKFPDYNEGKLSKIRSFLVSDNVIAETAIELGLNKFLRLGDGEEKSGGRKRISNNACMFEALLGAFYLYGKEAEIKEFLKKTLESKISDIIENLGKYNAKEILQEYTQSINKDLPKYETISTKGPAHKTIFEIAVFYHDEILATAEGSTKKAAEQNAAFIACQKLGLIK